MTDKRTPEPLSPELREMVTTIQLEAASIVLGAMDTARQVLIPGSKVEWDTCQMRLFLGLLGHITPSLRNARAVAPQVANAKELTDEQLQELAARERARVSKESAEDAVEIPDLSAALRPAYIDAGAKKPAPSDLAEKAMLSGDFGDD